MKYVRSYRSFIRESKREIDRNSLIVEKQVLNDFSGDKFWQLCVRSNVFSSEEKMYIEKNLSGTNYSLIKEEWEWLDKAVDYVKDKGGKFIDRLKNKIKSIKDGIKEFVKSMISIAKEIFLSLLSSAKKAAATVAEKAKKSNQEKIEKMDKEKAKGEVSSIKETFKWWGYRAKDVAGAVKDVALDVKSAGISAITDQLQKTESTVQSQSEENLKEAEVELENSGEGQGQDEKNESIMSIVLSAEDDVLMSFYKLVKEEKEEEGQKEGEKKKTGSKVVDFILDFLGQEKIDPEAKKGSKLLWWGKLFLKILAACLNPILKVLEAVVKFVAKNSLKAVSMVTQKFGGPGTFEFVLLGGLTAGLLGLVVDSMLFGGFGVAKYQMGDILSAIKSWLAHTLEHVAGTFLPGYDMIKTFLKGFCVAMAVWHIVDEIKHLSHGEHGHGEHKEGEHKEGGAAPVAAKPA